VTNFKITQRIATTVYDISNTTILRILDLGDATSTNFTASDFFKAFNVAIGVSLEPGFLNSTQYQMLEYLSVYFTPAPGVNVAYDKILQLKQFIATPVLVYNNQFLDMPGDLPSDNLNKKGDVVIPSYQVMITEIMLIEGNYFCCVFLGLCRRRRRCNCMVCPCIDCLHVHAIPYYNFVPGDQFRCEMYALRGYLRWIKRATLSPQ
jgi:hypothetical protein